ncbi:type VI secretion system tip protein TssI/VgrG [Polyangium sp. y55x31]|uniref:type VI secretion system Vgr family protein n=1 Tax=Polyangium sp. y55x31 TaxID=3042688 RepID=UPI002482AEDF|nr:type VI secretion system tip protein TssI/VgrG [Polyangium sp. y55x31]MDI1477251.1 type VI secretion system tip protein TssI/VgrG [Polyangium sp. y55x31]
MTIELELVSDALPEGTRILRARGVEAMNELPSWTVQLLSPTTPIDLEAIVGTPATLTCVDTLDGSTRAIDLLVVDAEDEGADRDGSFCALTLSAAMYVLDLRSGYRVFQEKTTEEIVREVLVDAGIPADRIVTRLAGADYEKRLYCVAYGETNLAFLQRLLAEEGINFWIDHVEGTGSVIVLGDALGSHDGVEPSPVVTFDDKSGLVGARGFVELEIEQSIVPTAVHVRDLDVRQPDVPVDGHAGEGALSYFEYPACVLTARGASDRAKARLEQLRRFEVVAKGRSETIRLTPGRLVDIEGAADAWMNQRYLIVRAEHAFDAPSRSGTTQTKYENRVTLVPAVDRPFRPALPTRRPKVEGIEPAFTTGPSGEEIHVDDLGRVKVRFPWDRSGTLDDRSSYWVRTLQMNMAGAMLLPRVGWEVPVAYVDGNPDRPFVLGRSYNATAIVPYGLPGAAATTTLQSATSPSDGTTNELRLGDGAGSQEMFLHASRDQTVVVGGSATTRVSANETHDVALAYKLAIGGSQSLTVGGSQSVDVGTDMVTAVKGARTEMIGAVEHIKVTANRVVGAKGAYNELIGAAYVIQCNQSNTKIDGVFTQLVGGSMSLSGGLGYGASVAAVSTEVVGGSRTITCAGGYGDTVRGAKTVTAGPTTEKAGSHVSTGGKATGTVQVGGSATFQAGAELVLEAPSITIEVGGSLKAGALVMSGGKVQSKKGKTKLEGTITRKSGTKVG